jgi:putative restriction endonuclease
MRFYVGVTDNQWFDDLRRLENSSPAALDEVNFWQPSPDSQFQALQRGNLFLFKLHRTGKTHKKDLITGGG